MCDVYFHSRYEVNFQDGIDCGGAYIKLLSDIDDLTLVGTHVSLLLSVIHVQNEILLVYSIHQSKCIQYII